MRYWKPEDICAVGCPFCGVEIEFWKDEPRRVCRGCGKEVRNPKQDASCADWCKNAPECLDSTQANSPQVKTEDPPSEPDAPR